MDARSLQREKIIDVLQHHLPASLGDIATNKYFLTEVSNLLGPHSPHLLSSFLIDASDFSPSFFKRFYHPSWRGLTQHTLDNQSHHFFSNRFNISSNLGLNLAAIWNYQIKIHLIKESSFMPQITTGVTHFFYLPVFGKDDDELSIKPHELHGVGIFGTISKSFSANTKFFFGGRYVYENYKVLFSQTFEQAVKKIWSNPKENILQLKNYKKHSGDFFTGINILSQKSDWETTLTIGTDFNKKLYWIWTKSFSFITLGVNFQALSVITLRPFMLLRVSF